MMLKQFWALFAARTCSAPRNVTRTGAVSVPSDTSQTSMIFVPFWDVCAMLLSSLLKVMRAMTLTSSPSA
eukprot:4685130-Amphidinium_carterae.1